MRRFSSSDNCRQKHFGVSVPAKRGLIRYWCSSSIQILEQKTLSASPQPISSLQIYCERSTRDSGPDVPFASWPLRSLEIGLEIGTNIYDEKFRTVEITP